MIRSVTVTNYVGETAKIVLNEEEPSHGFLITRIDGLGPAKATINSSELSLSDGSLFNSAHLEPRNIVINMTLFPASTIEEARLNTYRYFPIKNNVLLEFETDSRQVSIDGYVESNEPDIFSDNETSSISILCPDPYFYDTSGVSAYTSFNSVIPNFEFPYENPSVTEPLTEFGFIETGNLKNIEYVGDVSTGIIITITAYGATGDIIVSNYTYNEHMIISDVLVERATGHTIQANDVIVINTKHGNKSARLYRNGSVYNVLNSLGRTPSWLMLRKGANYFRYDTQSGIASMDLMIENDIVYEGI